MNITLADGSTNTLNSAVNYAGMQKLSSANSTISCEHASESDHSCDDTTCGTLTATGDNSTQALAALVIIKESISKLATAK